MNKFVIQSREDLLVMSEIFRKNDIPAQLSHLFDENGEEVGISLKLSDKIYFWSVGDEENV